MTILRSKIKFNSSLSFNNLTGEIEDSIGKLPNLKKMYVYLIFNLIQIYIALKLFESNTIVFK